MPYHYYFQLTPDKGFKLCKAFQSSGFATETKEAKLILPVGISIKPYLRFYQDVPLKRTRRLPA